MTELRHGSNVAGLQTEAVLDLATDEWVVHTPDEGAIKWWIGNAAEDGRAATVFARLKVRSWVPFFQCLCCPACYPITGSEPFSNHFMGCLIIASVIVTHISVLPLKGAGSRRQRNNRRSRRARLCGAAARHVWELPAGR